MSNQKNVECGPFISNIYLIGFMGTGKSTIAAYLNEHEGFRKAEMDEILSEKEGMSIPDIFSVRGEAYFRDRETELLKEISTSNRMVISCGGGIVLRAGNVELMKKSGIVVLLTASPETVLSRVKDDESRPLLNGRKTVPQIQEMMQKRRAGYENAADVIISTDGRTPDKICSEILERVLRCEAGDKHDA